MIEKPHFVILAAGRGMRMRSRRPKVMHPLLRRPMLAYLLDLVQALPRRSVTVVAGPGQDEVGALCAAYGGVELVLQPAQLGTADALRAAAPRLGAERGPALVLNGDCPLLKPATLKKLLRRHAFSGAACTLGTAFLQNPRGYGRVLRGIDGAVVDIREEADLGAPERAIHEVNAGVYCFSLPELWPALAKVENRNAQREFYLPDAVRILAQGGKKVMPFRFTDPAEILGVNDRWALWRAEEVLRERINKMWLHRGASLEDPRSILIDPACRLEPDCRVEAGCVLLRARVGAEALVEARCRIEDSEIGPGSRILQGCYVAGSRIGPGCVVGPYARLRPGTVLEAGARVGNFVEVKASRIGAGSKAAHLSYIGDADIGSGVNIGCGFITCNYDGGPVKRRTVVEDGVFIGSDCQAVAPVRLGRGCYIAAGSTITEDVPADALAIGRGRQVNKPGYAPRYRALRNGSNGNGKVH